LTKETRSNAVASRTVNTELSILGAKEALRELNKIDKVARRQVTKDYAGIVETVITEAKQLTPEQPPLSGMKHRWNPGNRGDVFPWNDARSDRTMKAFVSAKRPRQYGAYTSDLAVFGIRWTSASALVTEMSGRGPVPTAKGREMVDNLTRRYGSPGRFLWKAYLAHQAEVERRVEILIRGVMRRVQKDI
jgi:hypothetical protein